MGQGFGFLSKLKCAFEGPFIMSTSLNTWSQCEGEGQTSAMALDGSCFQMHIHNSVDKFLLKSCYELALSF